MEDDGQAILGDSPAIRQLRARIARVGPTEATVLILGERGTGKELVAGAVHAASRRRREPYLALNCAALPDELVASELFGHARGAFTGAVERAPGVLVSADGGTVFLDEVGDLSLRGQAMLLRFLEVQEVRPLGVAAPRRVDVRVVAATNRDLSHAVARGEFRADLWDRLGEVVLEVPPLRARREDVATLAAHFLAVQARRHGVVAHGFTRGAQRALAGHDWPGNVRELEKAVSRAVIFAEEGWIRAEDLGLRARQAWAGEAPMAELAARPGGVGIGPESDIALVSDVVSGLTARQREALALAQRSGAVRRHDLVLRFGISGETARRELGALVRAGLLTREGSHRGARYRPAAPDKPAALDRRISSPDATGAANMEGEGA